ncbi:MAG: hypothetical protein ACK4M7_00235, partial [Burkholderiales bacterium]
NQRGQPGPTTRLHLPAGFQILGYPPILPTDLSYKQVNEINQYILEYYSNKLAHSGDGYLAEMQLARLWDTEHLPTDCKYTYIGRDNFKNMIDNFRDMLSSEDDGVYNVENEAYFQILNDKVIELRVQAEIPNFPPNETILHDKLKELFINYTGPEEKLKIEYLDKKYHAELKQWLDYLNTLMFNVESSRLNVTVITGLMTLELIKIGKLSYKEAFQGNDDFGGQFSGANLRTGSHNYKARAQLLSCEGREGVRTDRQHPQWLAATLKEAITMVNWFKTFWLEEHRIDSKSMLRKDLLREFRIHVRVLAQKYLQVFSEV